MGISDTILGFANRLRNDSLSLKSSFENILSRTPPNYSKRKAIVSRLGLAHRIVWVIPQDALAQGWTCNSDTQKDLSKKEDDYFEIESKLFSAFGSARQNGGGWLWIVTGKDDESEPLVPGSKKVLAVHDLTMAEVTAFSMENDPRSYNFGKPDYWTIQVTRDGTSFYASKVHHSRLIYVPGAPVTKDTKTEKTGYDLSYLTLYQDILEDLDKAWASTSNTVSRLSMPWVRLKMGLAAAAADDGGEDGLAARMTVLKGSMNKDGIMVLLGDDEVGWTGPQVSGAKELITSIYERAASVEGIALSRLFGQSPGGLSTDDASGTRTYYDLLVRVRRTILTPVLLRLYEALYGEDNTRHIVWPDLYKPTELESAQAKLTLAQRDQILFSLDMLPEDPSDDIDENVIMEEDPNEAPIDQD